MKPESEIQRQYEKLERMDKRGHLSTLERERMKTLEWVLHTNE